MYEILTAKGPDAETFLQGQLTQDLRQVTGTLSLPAAWCTPRGRVIATLRVLRIDDGFALVLAAGHAATVLQKISIYRLRAKVDLEIDTDWRSAAVSSDEDIAYLEQMKLLPGLERNLTARSDGCIAVCADPDAPLIEVFATAGSLAELKLRDPLDAEGWLSATIRAGQVLIEASNTEAYTPHMLSLDLAGAISFNKGCYTGQEIVARTEHLGKSRRRLMRYVCAAVAAKPGDELHDEGHAVATVVNACRNDLLAVTPGDLHGKTLTLHGAAAVPAPLPW